MLKRLNKISEKSIKKNNWWDYRVDSYLLPNGKEGEYHFVRTSGSTFVIPEKDENVFIMTKQFRYLNQRESIEFPGGGLKADLSPIENAKYELQEEAGYSGVLKKVGEFNPFNGVTDEICHVFHAKDLKHVEATPEPSEEFEILELTINEINHKIQKGEIWDGMTLAAWSLYYFSKDSSA